MKELEIVDFIKAIIIPGVAIVSFSHFMIELFGQTIPNIVLSFFKEASFVIIVAAAIIFAITWAIRAIPHHRTKKYNLVCFDVFGQESHIDGLRTEFKTNDVAWSFMKQYKKSYPLYDFALVSENLKSEKKTVIRYL